MRAQSWYLLCVALVLLLIGVAGAAAEEGLEAATPLEEGVAEAALFETPSGCETPGDGLELFVPEAQQQTLFCGGCSSSVCAGQPHDHVCGQSGGQWKRCKGSEICPLEGTTLECYCTAGPIE